MASISRAVCLLLVFLALFQSAVQARVYGLTASDDEPKPVERIQKAFKEITELSNNLRIETEKITIFNAPTQGVKIGAGFGTIIVKITEYTARLAGTSYGYDPEPLPDADAKLVVQSLTTFVKVHQALLNVVIGKHGFATLIPFFEPIRVSLVNLEIVIDTFAFYLIDLIPTQKPAADDQFSALSVTLKDAQTTYSNSLQLAAPLPRTDEKLVDVINGAIKKVTELSDNLRKETEKINNFNAPKQGGKIALGFAEIIKNVIQASAALVPGSNPSPLGDDDAKLVVKTLTTFVQVHQALLNTVIGKHGLLALVPFFEPIRLTLVQLEVVVDTFAFNLINLIPTQQEPATKQVASLDVTIKDAVNTYSNSLQLAAPLPRTDEKLVDVINGAIKKVTELSDNLRKETEKINNFNAPKQGGKIALGLAEIIKNVIQASAALAPGSNPSPLGDDDAKLVVKTLTTFVQVHQALLNTVIGKHGLLALVPFFEPIRLTLVQLEIVVDTFAFNLINLIPTQQEPATTQVASLDVTIKDAVNTYSNSLQLAAPLPRTDKKLVDVINDAIKKVTELSDNLRKETEKINNFNAPKQGGKIALGLAEIIKNVIQASAALAPGSNPSPLGDDDAKLVVKTLTTFVQVHQALLNTVIGKHGLLALVPFFEPIRLTLVQLEIVVDTFAFNLINLIPTQQEPATKQVASLDVTIKDAVNTYSNSLQLAAPLPRTDKKLVDVINDAIKKVTELSDNLRKETEKINNFNAPKQGGKIALGLAEIIKNVIQASAALAPGSNPSPLGDDDAKLVVKTLTTFVQVHQALLNTVIGKHGLLTLIPFFEPIRLTLVQLEIVVDTFAFNLINLIPTQQEPATKQVASLDVTIKDAVNTYSNSLLKTALAHAFY